MQVNLYQKNIDQHLSSALEKGGTNGSGFKWYLATQVYDVALYHPKNSDECEGLLPYPSINLPTAPKAILRITIKSVVVVCLPLLD